MVGVGAWKSAEMMGDRVEVAVCPIPDGGQDPVGVEVERIGAAAKLGRQKGDPFAEPSPANVRARVDERALDIVALRLSVTVARMLSALVGNGAASHQGIGHRRCFACNRGACDDLKKIAAIEARRGRRFVRRRRRLRDGDGRRLSLPVHVVLKGAMVGLCYGRLSPKIALNLLARGERAARLLHS